MSGSDDLKSLVTDLLAKRRLGWISESDAVARAQDALAEGHDSVHLRILAGLPRLANPFEVDAEIEAVLKEFGWPLLDRNQSVLWLLQRTAQKILTTDMDVDVGATTVYRLAQVLGDSTVLHDWSLICDDLHPETHEDLTSDRLSEVVHEFARKLLERHSV